VIGQGRLELTVELEHVAHRTDEIARIKTAAAPGNGMQVKSFRPDRGAMTVNAGCDVHLEPGISGRLALSAGDVRRSTNPR
jgi:hypothetical protein